MVDLTNIGPPCYIWCLLPDFLMSFCLSMIIGLISCFLPILFASLHTMVPSYLLLFIFLRSSLIVSGRHRLTSMRMSLAIY
ncbi:hypothetical protein GGR54DRAFT_620360 [Hypoxylon sp. NC1633]|nr:hypothetical protein GGR54DRAFT_620360 [Hypoxylon sp. NC1633]